MSQVQGTRRAALRSCLVMGLIIWSLISCSLIARFLYVKGFDQTSLWRANETVTPTPPPETPTAAIALLQVRIETPLPLPPTDTPAPTPTSLPPTLPPTPTATDTPTPPPVYQFTNTVSIPIYAEQRYEKFLTSVVPEVVHKMKIQARTTDLQWLQVCCLSGGGVSAVWVPAAAVTVVAPDIFQSDSMQHVLPFTPTPIPPTPTHFQIEAGPEYYPTDNGFLSIFVKVFRGPAGAQQPLAGYKLHVRFKAKGKDEFIEMPATNVGMLSVGEFALFKGNVHLYNLKYEYYPIDITNTRSVADLVGEGDWEMWLSNEQNIKLSEPVPFTTAPLNRYREIFISFGQVR